MPRPQTSRPGLVAPTPTGPNKPRAQAARAHSARQPRQCIGIRRTHARINQIEIMLYNSLKYTTR